jgi:hypothetical protein
MKSTLLIAVALSCVSAVTSVADSTKFVAPAFRGQPNADFAGWEVFTVPTGANNPDVAGSDAVATLAQTSAGAMLVGGGNIYAGPFAIGAFSVSYDVSSPLATVVFQVRTLGLEPNYNSISLNYGSGTLTAARTELERATDNSMPGSMAVTSSWTWDLTGVNATALTINLGATTPHVVLDAAQLDVAAVPEPETWAMISGVGLLAFAVWRRR